MSYEKQTWINGDTITAEKLNHMEDGIKRGANLVLSETTEERDSGTGTITKHILNVTFNDMINTIQNGDFLCVIRITEEYGGIDYKNLIIPNDMSPFQIIDSEEAGGLAVGYYLWDVFTENEDDSHAGNPNLFYSETPDGVMSYEEGSEK